MNLLDQLNLLTGNLLLLFALLFAFAFLNVVFPPIPLESAILFGGYLSGTGRVSALIIVGASASGMFLGSLLLYLLVKRFGIAFIDRTPLCRVFSKSVYHRAAEWLQKYGLWAAFFSKFVPGMSLCVVIGLGILRVSEKKAVFVLLLSNFLFFSALTAAGYLLGRRWGNALLWLSSVSRFWMILLAIAVCYGIFRIFIKPKRVTKL